MKGRLVCVEEHELDWSEQRICRQNAAQQHPLSRGFHIFRGMRTTCNLKHPVCAEFIWDVKCRSKSRHHEKRQNQRSFHKTLLGNREHDIYTTSHHKQRSHRNRQANAAVHRYKQPVLGAASEDAPDEIKRGALERMPKKRLVKKPGERPLMPRLPEHS